MEKDRSCGDHAGPAVAETVPISRVEPRLDQPRSLFREEALQALAESISSYGILQPLTVRRLPGGYFQIIAGERRWRAARMAGLQEIPVQIIEADDQLVQELSLIENLQREDLNPIEEARGYKVLQDEYGLTQQEISDRIGCSRTAVANSLRLLSLPPSVLHLIENGDLSAGHARALVSLPSREMQEQIAQQAVEQSYSVRQVEAIAARLNASSPKEEPAAPSADIDYAAYAGELLTQKLGRKVKIVSNALNRGHVELDFYDADDRENLLKSLQSLSPS